MPLGEAYGVLDDFIKWVIEKIKKWIVSRICG
jgi:hypothetical protein